MSTKKSMSSGWMGQSKMNKGDVCLLCLCMHSSNLTTAARHKVGGREREGGGVAQKRTRFHTLHLWFTLLCALSLFFFWRQSRLWWSYPIMLPVQSMVRRLFVLGALVNNCVLCSHQSHEQREQQSDRPAPLFILRLFPWIHRTGRMHSIYLLLVAPVGDRKKIQRKNEVAREWFVIGEGVEGRTIKTKDKKKKEKKKKGQEGKKAEWRTNVDMNSNLSTCHNNSMQQRLSHTSSFLSLSPLPLLAPPFAIVTLSFNLKNRLLTT